jgi:hypothetical protein
MSSFIIERNIQYIMLKFTREALSMIGVMATESIKISAGLSSILLMISFLFATMSGISGNTVSLINSVEATFVFFGVSMVFSVSYFIIQNVTVRVSTKDSYYYTKRMIP